ncbi:Pseudouridine-5'-phosphatase [Dermatophagoides farinae]|uniref:Pseudouridine-5'-phosphatase n=2 Tax=Dermatophagoides farinae TaxID=6954 RepID=A0A922I8N7_DERFA|nr:Pseudouridine-5'-phosphatase [Dermatophagoides farinae]
MNKPNDNTKMKITHILFDFDGTLVNTIDTIVNIVERIVTERNRQMTNEIRDFIPNMTSYRSLLNVINEELNLQITLDEFKVDMLQKHLDADIKLMPGVKQLVEHLYHCHIPMAIATGNSKSFYEVISAKFGNFFPKHFHHCVCAYDDQEVANQKPSPDVYYIAAKRFPQPPVSMENVLIFEDSMTGLKGAIASGAHTVFVTKNSSQIQTKEHNELVKKTDLRLETLEQFDPKKFNLHSSE